MSTNIYISHTSMIFEFVDIGFNTLQIYDSLRPSIIELMKKEKLSIPDEWTLYFNAGYTNSKTPLVSKNKIGSYPSDKMKEITIIIPIPLKSEIDWGVNPEQHLYKKDHYDKLMKNFFELNIDFKNYTNRTDYVTACLKAGIKKAFEQGFTVGGMKVKANVTSL
ncbi:Imm9 family immunity protein [Runella slithyformis]|uniref:Uncharacterized protein n=1 Tax=Runella slithyformis (strain ATCC 29530 / DSM 19594 / LMG 11500 / NCIMB 11436 / LSU 4) TaxID=761193 RepID=A0A7U3ZRS0_RUNSL|nr:Imm9 family immunity protein [Runella slithyformis]AEI52171.1 hypothetical protein Runsl_5875 [Runella slithyformis DSM 19594]